MEVCLKSRAIGRNHSGRRAEESRVIDEPRVLGLLDRATSPDGFEPVR
jgi:hypothetical protein